MERQELERKNTHTYVCMNKYIFLPHQVLCSEISTYYLVLLWKQSWELNIINPISHVTDKETEAENVNYLSNMLNASWGVDLTLFQPKRPSILLHYFSFIY